MTHSFIVVLNPPGKRGVNGHRWTRGMGYWADGRAEFPVAHQSGGGGVSQSVAHAIRQHIAPGDTFRAVVYQTTGERYAVDHSLVEG